MSLPIEFLPEASSDIEVAFQWYEQQQLGLGFEFLAFLDAAFTEVVRRPFSFPKVLRKTRKVVLRRFPYLLFFSIEESRILVTGVFHAHREPGSWNDRIRERAASYSDVVARGSRHNKPLQPTGFAGG